MKQWDVFISHASEDKTTVAIPLAQQLKAQGLRVWLDKHEISLGDSLREKIDEGLADSSFGVVVLSAAFLAKHWPKQELNGLAAREEQGRKVILPVWKDLDKQQLAAASPILADRVAANVDQGIPAVAAAIAAEVFKTYRISFNNDHELIVLPLLDETRRCAFAVSRHPTTNQQYFGFCQDTSHEPPMGESFDRNTGSWEEGFAPWSDPLFNNPDQPVVCISYDDATRYCSWIGLANGHPAVASTSLVPPVVCDFAAIGSALGDFKQAIFSRTKSFHHRAEAPASIDYEGTRTNAFGIADLFGNVFEWCSERLIAPPQVTEMIGEVRDRIISGNDHVKAAAHGYARPLSWGVPTIGSPYGPMIAALGAVGRSYAPLEPNLWKLEYLVKGGSFLDDLQHVTPVANASKLPKKTDTKHFDLGFRICALVKIDGLPPSVQIRLEEAPNAVLARPETFCA